jgi:DNA-binding MarR family transcriptional regulator
MTPAVEPSPTLPFTVAPSPGESVDSWITALAARHGMHPVALLPRLGLPAAARGVKHLMTAPAPADWRRIERLARVQPGALDTAIGAGLPDAWAASAASRFCPDCLTENGGRWPLSWRWWFAFACPAHARLLIDTCPGCGAAPRRWLPGSSDPAMTTCCLRGLNSKRCRTDLSAVTAGPAVPPALIQAQRWLDGLLAGGRHGDPVCAAAFADLPAVVSFVLNTACTADVAGLGAAAADAWDVHAATMAARTSRAPKGTWRPKTTPLLAGAMSWTAPILNADEPTAIEAIRTLLSRRSGRRLPPPGTPYPVWKTLSATTVRRFLRAADPDLPAMTRLRHRTPTSAARLADGSATARASCIPQLLWPDWSSRLLPAAGTEGDYFRAACAALLLIPGQLTTRATAAARHRLLSAQYLSWTLQTLTADSDDALVLTCRLADFLDTHGAHINYRRRSEIFTEVTLNFDEWSAMAFTANAHPGEDTFNGRHQHAKRYLAALVTGADPDECGYQLAFTDSSDRARYLEFAEHLPTALRRSLHTHAATALARLGIDEPVTWSPPAELAEGLHLPGVDPGHLDLPQITRLLIEQGQSAGRIGAAMGVNIEHIRLAAEHLDHTGRAWSHTAAPSVWRRRQAAEALLTRAFFEREYVRGGKTLRQIEAETGIARKLIADLARRTGIEPRPANAPKPIDPAWLRTQYLERARSTTDIAAELGITEMTCNKAIHRLGIPMRAPGVHARPEMVATLPADIPDDIRAAVENGLGGWDRLHRYATAMLFPSLSAAGRFLGIKPETLSTQIARLEHDIGHRLLHRSAPGRPQHPTPAGQALLDAIEQPNVHTLMAKALGPDWKPSRPNRSLVLREDLALIERRRPAQADPWAELQITRPKQIGPATIKTLQALLEYPTEERYAADIGHRADLGPGTIYPILGRLTRAGWTTERWEDEQSWKDRNKPRVKHQSRQHYYQLTPEGRRAAQIAITERQESRRRK